jgi:glycosyltransferase involved in cell wall biosynthesis
MEPIGAGVKDSEFSVNEQKFVDCVSLGVFAVRKDDFIQMLGFDLSYDPIYYEDADLCLKFKEVMLRSLYVPGSVVVHHNSCRVAQSQNDSSLKLRNRATFEHRWRNRSAHGNGEPKAERIFPTENIGIGPINLSPSKVAVYTPYPLIKGGGEKFILSLASVLKGDAPPLILSNHLWSRSRLLTQTRALGIDINEFRLQTYSSVNGADQNLELFFSLGNNLFPEVRGIAKRNFYICQFPFPSDAPMNNDSKKWLYEYSAVIFYSEFVRGYYLSQLSAANLPEIDTFVLSPPIKRLIGNQVKDKKILHVGRFFAGGHQKKQLELVRAFRDLYSNGDLLDWELHLVGSVHHEVSAADYFLQVASEATGFPIFIHPEITEEELEDLYKCSSIYWHATGLGIDEQLSPWAHEHFGMSTVEAMGAGCIPLVIGTGGQKEIVVHGKSGFHWKTINELKQQTISLTKQYGSPENEVMRSAAELRAEHYNFVKFREKLHDLLERKNAPVSQR